VGKSLSVTQHIAVAGLLTLAIVAAMVGSDHQLRDDIQAIRDDIVVYEQRLCARINLMHKTTQGFDVLDCTTGKVLPERLAGMPQ